MLTLPPWRTAPWKPVPTARLAGEIDQFFLDARFRRSPYRPLQMGLDQIRQGIVRFEPYEMGDPLPIELRPEGHAPR